jgi:hypothetical protein
VRAQKSPPSPRRRGGEPMIFFQVVVAIMTVSINTSGSATPIITIMVMFKQSLYYYHSNK